MLFKLYRCASTCGCDSKKAQETESNLLQCVLTCKDFDLGDWCPEQCLSYFMKTTSLTPTTPTSPTSSPQTLTRVVRKAPSYQPEENASALNLKDCYQSCDSDFKHSPLAHSQCIAQTCPGIVADSTKLLTQR